MLAVDEIIKQKIMSKMREDNWGSVRFWTRKLRKLNKKNGQVSVINYILHRIYIFAMI